MYDNTASVIVLWSKLYGIIIIIIVIAYTAAVYVTSQVAYTAANHAMHLYCTWNRHNKKNIIRRYTEKKLKAYIITKMKILLIDWFKFFFKNRQWFTSY